jgi:hypothetical protein
MRRLRALPFFVALDVDRLVRTEALRLEASAVDAVVDEVLRTDAARRFDRSMLCSRAPSESVCPGCFQRGREVGEHLDRAVEGDLGARLDRVLVDVEVDALDDAADLLDGLRQLVGAAVGVVDLVDRLRLVRALVERSMIRVLVAVGAALQLARPGLVRAASISAAGTG